MQHETCLLVHLVDGIWEVSIKIDGVYQGEWVVVNSTSDGYYNALVLPGNQILSERRNIKSAIETARIYLLTKFKDE